jgi:hypothetical protein
MLTSRDPARTEAGGGETVLLSTGHNRPQTGDC